MSIAPDPVRTGWRGFFGKIPQAGDFVSAGLPRDVETTFDNWLRAAMRESQMRLGRGWLDAFLVTPVWRFVLEAGSRGADPVSGVMMPSVDRVGRYFPLVVAAARPDLGRRDPLALTEDPLFFDAAEALVMSCLRASDIPGDLAHEVDALPFGSLPNLAAPDAADTDAPAAYWWTGTDGARAHLTRALPAPADFAEMFMGPPEANEDASDHQAQLKLTEANVDTRARAPGAAPIQLLRAEHASACLRGTRSATLTEVAAVNKDGQAFSVLSGIGSAPSLASQIKGLAPVFEDIANPYSMSDLIAAAKGKFGSANTRLAARAGMRTAAEDPVAAAAVVLLVQARRYAVLWVGHCSAFLFRDGTLFSLNRPHVDTRLRGVVTQALGVGQTITPSIGIGQVEPADCFLLASPGVTTALSHEDIAEALGHAQTPQAAVAELTQDALIAGASLDASALCVSLLPRDDDL
ncbi:type VI secretion system-associated protein TagF [Tateyamaria omphalii]|uniref:Type VI secretion-associated protein n=1 Tax=Tateyamaria omphalii TaxID=299262 RepID=A0A1P8MVB7_9RHOB|nr:type VI secretion system-associated protein TagF [Tateyamaria omphalii]APX11994.1 type VI secretion-associated protein [Tateyamaria omphalii]